MKDKITTQLLQTDELLQRSSFNLFSPATFGGGSCRAKVTPCSPIRTANLFKNIINKPTEEAEAASEAAGGFFLFLLLVIERRLRRLRRLRVPQLFHFHVCALNLYFDFHNETQDQVEPQELL